MATYQNRESFIPYSRRTLIELCLTDSDFTPENQQRFRDFCEILIAYYHFKFHSLSEKLKENFVTFNPEKEEKENQNDSVKQELIHQNKIQLLKYFLHAKN